MPKKGERKTVGGVTGEWDGTDWREVLPEVPSREASMTISADPAAPAGGGGGPKKGDRKTVEGITGEFDGTDWREVVPDTPAKDPKSILGFLGNAVTSTGGLIGGSLSGMGEIANTSLQAMANPVKYASELLANPATMAAAKDPLGTAGKVGGAAADYFGKRYGGVQNVLDTAYEDPAGVAADLSTVLTLGGSAGARAPGLAGRIARGVAATGAAIDPLTNVGRAGIVAAAPIRRGAEGAAEWLNKRAFKIPKHITDRNPNLNLNRELAAQGITHSLGSQEANRARIAPDEAALDVIGANSTATTTPAQVTSELRRMAADKRGLLKGGTLHSEAGQVDEAVQRIMTANTAAPSTPPLGPPATSASFAAAPGAGATAPPALPALAPAQGAMRTPAPAPPRPAVSYQTPQAGAWGTAPATPPPPAVGYGAGMGATAPPMPPPVVPQGALSAPAPLAAAGAPTPVGGFTPYGPFDDITFQTNQANKVALNQRLQGSFANKVTPIDTDIMHGERKGAMLASEAMEPGVIPINERLGPRYAIDDVLTEALGRQSTVTPSMWGTLVNSPYLKSLAAKGLWKVGDNATEIAAALEQAGPTLTRAALLQRLAASQER